MCLTTLWHTRITTRAHRHQDRLRDQASADQQHAQVIRNMIFQMQVPAGQVRVTVADAPRT